MILAFEKWEGLGNDFVIVAEAAWELVEDGAATAARICSRHFGVGADGVLVVSTGGGRMIVLNPDGSRPEMCGNGLRCVAAQRGDGVWTIETDDGPYVCEVKDGQVTVPMGQVERGATAEIQIAGETLLLHRASTGNPHAVTVVQEDPVQACARLGPSLTSHMAFSPEGANIGFARVMEPSHVALAVWERGAGATLACGTGACAAVATLVHLGLCPSDRAVRVSLPGGDLSIRASARGVAVMRGPATRVFKGELEL